MPIATGSGSYLGVGEESVWGTSVARAKFVRVNSAGLKRTTARERRPGLGLNGAAAFTPTHLYTKSDDAGGPISGSMYFNDGGVGMLLAAALGTVTDAGVGPYTHTYKLTTPNTTAPSLTMEQGYGEIDAEVFEGCVVSEFELSVEAGSPMSWSATVIAETSGGLGAQGTPAFDTAAEEVDYEHFGSISWNSDTFVPISISAKVNRGYERRRRLGSLLTAQPVQASPISIEITAVLEHGSDADYTALHAAWLAETQSDWIIIATGTTNNRLTITGHNAIIVDVSEPIGGTGVIRSTVKWMCLADASDMGLAIELRNDEATYKT